MLENVLRDINSSLKEITKVLEDLCKIAKEPLEVTALDTIKEETNQNISINQPMSQPMQQTQISTNPVPQAPMQITNTVPQAPSSASTSAPVNAQVNAQVPQTIPTTQVAESFTQEQLAVAMSNAVAAGKMAVIQGVLKNFGVQALTQINPADYNKVATMLKEAGVQV